MEYLAILLGAVLIILLLAGIVFFFGNVLRASLFKDFKKIDIRKNEMTLVALNPSPFRSYEKEDSVMEYVSGE